MLHDPVEESFFEADVMAGLLALYPLVTEDLLPFREEFLIEKGLANEFGRFICRGAHYCEHNFWNF